MVPLYGIHMTKTQRTQLPSIIQFTGVTDSGEYGNATCPHCGADGRYVYHFVTTEGAAGAMAGCIKLFPVSPVAKAHQAVLDKQRAGKNLNGWDRKIAEACERLYRGEIDEAAALHLIQIEQISRKQWMASKGYGR